MSDLSDFLSNEKKELTSQPKFVGLCRICREQKLADEVLEYAQGRIAGNISFTVYGIWKSYFGPKYGMGSWRSIEQHIKMHLGMNLPNERRT